MIEAGDYAPTTANGWMSILSLIFKAARRDFGLLTIPTDGLERFDLSEHIVYSEEQPNSLRPAQVGPFLAKLREMHPRHFAMAFLGFATGLRPSSLRPLRRKGPEPDVRWDEHRLLVRRSHVGGDEVMLTTKQRRRYSIQLPAEAMDVLRWHVDTQLETDEQLDSHLLFPSTTGGFRAPCVLNAPFAEVAEEMNLGFRFTQRGMRRTFTDLARQAQILDVITRSISGHCTTQMQHHYSTVQPEEQRESIARVLDLLATAATSRENERSSHWAPNLSR